MVGCIVLTNIPTSQLRRPVIISTGLALLWIVVALVRDGSTFHLAPALVAVVSPVVFAFDTEDEVSTRDAAFVAFAGLAVALVATLILTRADQLTGPSLLPFGGAVTESVVLAVVGAVAGFVIALLQGRGSG